MALLLSEPNQSSLSQFRSGSHQKPSSSTSSELTKRQRQNTAKWEAKKAAKASAEADRLATLAKKRELERTKMLKQFASVGGGKGGDKG